MQRSHKGKTALFLDRDGVINKRPPNDYVKKPEEFIFIPGAVEAIKKLSALFDYVIVVTNQQGIGKGVMSEDDLAEVHHKMKRLVEKAGGRIDRVYYCPDLATKEENCRKPALAMANRAKEDFPELNFAKSVMVGDTETDILFGKNAGMKSILIDRKAPFELEKLADGVFNTLHDFALSFSAND